MALVAVYHIGQSEEDDEEGDESKGRELRCWWQRQRCWCCHCCPKRWAGCVRARAGRWTRALRVVRGVGPEKERGVYACVPRAAP